MFPNKNKKNRIISEAGIMSASGLIKKKILIRLFTIAVTIIFWLIIWYALARYIDKEIILPEPYDVLRKFPVLMEKKEFWISCGMTVLRVGIGTSMGCIAGIILAGIMLVLKTVHTIISPLLSAIKATPVASFIIAALFWIDRGHIPAFISFLIVLPIICDAVYTGIKNTDKNLIEITKIYKFTVLKCIKHLYIPTTIPYFLSALRSAIGMAWKSGVAAEVLCTPADSIGKEINLTKVYMETTDMFAWTLIIILLSITFEKISVALIGKALKKYGIMTEAHNDKD